MSLRVFPGASTSIAAISNQSQQFYPNSSHLQNNNTIHQRNQFANHQHLQGFANTSDDAMDINIS
jgi:hypothetical protein